METETLPLFANGTAAAGAAPPEPSLSHVLAAVQALAADVAPLPAPPPALSAAASAPAAVPPAGQVTAGQVTLADVLAVVQDLAAEVKRSRSAQAVGPLQLLTIDQACVALGLSRTKIYLLIKEGRIQTTRVGRRQKISLREIERFIDRHTPTKKK
ncbi:MAG TPA: helix-turn-helix domain-containing protein [Gemmataceae bacterium]|nr:helix-turn-helix domain-containing protein [Gemmataceae bacterium]